MSIQRHRLLPVSLASQICFLVIEHFSLLGVPEFLLCAQSMCRYPTI
jgi:hypothetical protein